MIGIAVLGGGYAMKEMNLLVWLTQLGLSLVIPLGSFIFLGFWLHHSIGWGRWVLILGIALGILTGVRSLWDALKIMTKMDASKPPEKIQQFNDHV